MKTKMKKLLAFMCAIAIVATSVTVWQPASPVEAAEDTSSTEVTPVYLPGFKHFTTTNYFLYAKNSGDVYELTTTAMPNSFGKVGAVRYGMKDFNNVSDNDKNTFNRALLSMEVEFAGESGMKETDQYIAVAGSNGNRTHCFQIRPNVKGDTLYFGEMGEMVNGEQEFIHLQAADAFGNDTSNFRNNEFMLQISFESGDYDNDNDGVADDIKFGFYINGKACKATSYYYYDCDIENRFRSGLAVYNNTDYEITIKPVVPENKELTHVTWSDYVQAGHTVGKTETYYADSKIIEYSLHKTKFGSEYDHMDKTSFEVDLRFDDATPTKDRIIFKYAGSATADTGIQMRPVKSSSTGEYNMYIRGAETTEPTVTRYMDGETAQSPNAKLGTIGNVAGTEFRLKITTEFGDYDGDGSKDDVQMGFYMNNEMSQGRYLYAYSNSDTGIENIVNDFGRYIRVQAKAGINIKSVEDTRDPYVTLDGFRNITASSFVDQQSGTHMESGEYSGVTKTYSMKNDLNGDLINGYDNALLTLKLKFSNSGNTSRIDLLGKDNKTGFYISTEQDGKLLAFTSLDNTTSVAQRRYIRAVDIDTTLTDENAEGYFLNNEFSVQISFEYGDFDGGGAADDLKINFYFKRMRLNSVYDDSTGDLSNIIYNCNMDNIGSCLTVRVEEGQSITVNSFDPTAPEGPTKEFYNLSTGAYTLPENATLVNGVEATGALALSGVYEISDATKVLRNVWLYQTGNAHIDETADVMDTKDLVATLKLSADEAIASNSQVAVLGADADNNGALTADDVVAVRALLVK